MNLAVPAARGSAEGPRFALFEAGFRPFFLLAALAAVAGVPAWLCIHAGALTLPAAWPATLWHAHEMVFGFAGAGVAGFMLTAVPNWTGAAPVRGARLMLLAALWLAGRVALALSASIAAPLVAAADLALFPVLGLFVAPPLVAAARESGPRNLVFLVLLAALATANLLTHLEALGITSGTALPGLRFALGLLALMITMVGGRIVPAFTTNALKRAGAANLPRSKAPVEAAAIGSVALLAALALCLEPGVATGAVAALAAVANAARLALWRPLATRREPILWVLHLGYAWLAASLALLAAADLADLLPHSAGLHALAVGAVGTMLLAVMSRASLGHTGRPLIAPPAAVVAYGLVSAAALLRIAATLPGGAEPLLAASGIAFAAAYALFAAAFGKVLLLGRADGKPG